MSKKHNKGILTALILTTKAISSSLSRHHSTPWMTPALPLPPSPSTSFITHHYHPIALTHSDFFHLEWTHLFSQDRNERLGDRTTVFPLKQGLFLMLEDVTWRFFCDSQTDVWTFFFLYPKDEFNEMSLKCVKQPCKYVPAISHSVEEQTGGQRCQWKFCCILTFDPPRNTRQPAVKKIWTGKQHDFTCNPDTHKCIF